MREQLSALIDDALGAEERSAVDAHLATCAECRRELEQLRGTVGLLRAVEPARAPAGFVDRVLEAARPEPWPRRLFRALLLPWPVKLPVEAAAIVLVAVGVVYVFRSSLELQGARFYNAPPGTIELRETAPPSSSDANRAATQPPEATRPPETAGKQQATRTPEAAKAKEAAGTRDLGQAADKQAPEQKALEKKSPDGPPAAKTAPPTQAFTEAERQSKDADERRAKLDDASRDVAKRQANVPPPTPAEPQVAGKLEESPARAERSQGAALGARARSSAASAPEPRTDTLQAPRPAAPPAVASFVAPDVSGRLAVANRDAALQDLARLLGRLGGVEDRRFVGDEGPILELTIPREAYPQFLREIAALGRWQLIREAPALPETVRLVLRITG